MQEIIIQAYLNSPFRTHTQLGYFLRIIIQSFSVVYKLSYFKKEYFNLLFDINLYYRDFKILKNIINSCVSKRNRNLFRENSEVLILVENVLKNMTTFLKFLKCFQSELAVIKLFISTTKLLVQSVVYTYQYKLNFNLLYTILF